MVKRSFSHEEDSGCDAGGCFGLYAGGRRNDGNQPPAPAAPDVVQNPDVNLVEEWNQLSIEERNQVYEDVHGVVKDIPETPELLESSLAELQVELDKRSRARRLTGSSSSGGGGSSYDLALAKGRSFVENPTFRLAFLRCERFDIENAAQRYLNYFDLVQYLFGDELLGREVTMDDLGPKETKELRNGHIQFLLQRDSAGRAIQFLDPIALMEIYSLDEDNEKIHVRCFREKPRFATSTPIPIILLLANRAV
jgi:hypothetical protein